MPEFKVDAQTIGAVAVFRVSGYLDKISGETFLETAKKHIRPGTMKVLLNIKEAPIINSSGLGILMEVISNIVDEKGGILAVSGMSNLVKSSFEAVGALPMIKEFPTEDDALAALK
jgi:anti-anti-sigma factor